MAAAAVLQSRKRCVSPFLDEASPSPPPLAKRGRFSGLAAQQQQQQPTLASLVSCAAARSDDGGMHECAGFLVEQMAAATDLADARNRASWILALIKDAVVGQENASLRAHAAASSAETSKLQEENASLRAHAAASSAETTKLQEENAALRAHVAAQERDNAVLKRGVAVLHARHEETERAAAEMKKKVAELELANYALGVRLRDADNCRFQAFRGHDAF